LQFVRRRLRRASQNCDVDAAAGSARRPRLLVVDASTLNSFPKRVAVPATISQYLTTAVREASGGLPDVTLMRPESTRFWRPDPAARRASSMPAVARSCRRVDVASRSSILIVDDDDAIVVPRGQEGK
jgi:hypothetical protein